MSPDNPLLTITTNIPFDAVLPEHIAPAVATLRASAQEALDAIPRAHAEGRLTYDSTIGALDVATAGLDFALGVAAHLESTASTPALRDAYAAVQEEVAVFYSGIALSAPIYEALAAYAATDEGRALTGGRRRLLDKTLLDFVKNGVNLDAAGKKRLAELDVELAQTTLLYSQNTVDATNAFSHVVDAREGLSGVPDGVVAAAAEAAKQRGLEGYLLTLHAPLYVPIMTYADDRALRERLYRANVTRATTAPGDNLELALTILRLREEKAKLLGFPDFAELVLSDRMAKSGEKAQAFVDDLRARIAPAFARENAELDAFVREVAGDAALPLAPWDVAYYAEKLRRKRYEFDDEALRPYFPLDRVSEGLFRIAEELYGVRVVPWTAEEADGAPRPWNSDVLSYVVRDHDGTRLGAFYMDLFPRADKRDGAWMGGMLDRLPGTPHERENVAVIVGNMTPPALGARTALLTHREVETLFHEFGHLLHHVLSAVRERALAGTRVLSDFVELPSMLTENFAWEKEGLDLFARHVESGAGLPEDMRQRMKAARTFRAANMLLRQLGFSTVDLLLHRTPAVTSKAELLRLARDTFQPFSPAALPDDYAMIASFAHLFGSPYGYAAGYYSYQWAEVLDADAFTPFKDAGVLSREVGFAFRAKVLARGDEAPPEELYRDFLGRDPTVDALVARMDLGGGAPAGS